MGQRGAASAWARSRSGGANVGGSASQWFADLFQGKDPGAEDRRRQAEWDAVATANRQAAEREWVKREHDRLWQDAQKAGAIRAAAEKRHAAELAAAAAKAAADRVRAEKEGGLVQRKAELEAPPPGGAAMPLGMGACGPWRRDKPPIPPPETVIQRWHGDWWRLCWPAPQLEELAISGRASAWAQSRIAGAGPVLLMTARDAIVSSTPAPTPPAWARARVVPSRERRRVASSSSGRVGQLVTGASENRAMLDRARVRWEALKQDVSAETRRRGDTASADWRRFDEEFGEQYRSWRAFYTDSYDNLAGDLWPLSDLGAEVERWEATLAAYTSRFRELSGREPSGVTTGETASRAPLGPTFAFGASIGWIALAVIALAFAWALASGVSVVPRLSSGSARA